MRRVVIGLFVCATMLLGGCSIPLPFLGAPADFALDVPLLSEQKNISLAVDEGDTSARADTAVNALSKPTEVSRSPVAVSTPRPVYQPKIEPGAQENSVDVQEEGADQQGVIAASAIPLDLSRPMIALTFDDGPGRGTERILDLLSENGGRATFFVIGDLAGKNPNTVRQIAEQGCEVANHTWGHKKLTDLAQEDILQQIGDVNDMVETVTGTRPRLLRPPGGEYNDVVLEIARQMDMALVNWSIDPKDWKRRDADAIYEAIMKDARDGGIVICHDIYNSTAEAMERVIPELTAQGYQLVTASELLGSREGGIQPGVAYRKR